MPVREPANAVPADPDVIFQFRDPDEDLAARSARRVFGAGREGGGEEEGRRSPPTTWARSEAMPSQEEIRRVRRLIERVKADLDDLTAEERAQIGDAVAVVRRSRSVMLGMPRIGQPLPDVHTTRTA
jgi:hypothetical protein